MADPPVTCMSCAWSHPRQMERDGALVLQCRRFPPVLVAIGGHVAQGVPQVEADDWCGEYSREQP